jgi:hypothetical protein
LDGAYEPDAAGRNVRDDGRIMLLTRKVST